MDMSRDAKSTWSRNTPNVTHGVRRIVFRANRGARNYAQTRRWRTRIPLNEMCRTSAYKIELDAAIYGDFRQALGAQQQPATARESRQLGRNHVEVGMEIYRREKRRLPDSRETHSSRNMGAAQDTGKTRTAERPLQHHFRCLHSPCGTWWEIQILGAYWEDGGY